MTKREATHYAWDLAAAWVDSGAETTGFQDELQSEADIERVQDALADISRFCAGRCRAAKTRSETAGVKG